jgi:MinD-like ATPase involved in chromosome partitioning or flagellar assembly
VDLPTYTNIWRIEKRLYKLYDLRLPMPMPLVQIGVFVGVFLPWIILLQLVRVPFHAPWHVVYIVPPGVLTWLATRPVIEGKRLTELLISQVRYLTEARTWARMTPNREPGDVAVVGRVWRRRPGAVRGRVHAGRSGRHARRAHGSAPAPPTATPPRQRPPRRREPVAEQPAATPPATDQGSQVTPRDGTAAVPPGARTPGPHRERARATPPSHPGSAAPEAPGRRAPTPAEEKQPSAPPVRHEVAASAGPADQTVEDPRPGRTTVDARSGRAVEGPSPDETVEDPRPDRPTVDARTRQVVKGPSPDETVEDPRPDRPTVDARSGRAVEGPPPEQTVEDARSDQTVVDPRPDQTVEGPDETIEYPRPDVTVEDPHSGQIVWPPHGRAAESPTGSPPRPDVPPGAARRGTPGPQGPPAPGRTDSRPHTGDRHGPGEPGRRTHGHKARPPAHGGWPGGRDDGAPEESPARSMRSGPAAPVRPGPAVPAQGEDAPPRDDGGPRRPFGGTRRRAAAKHRDGDYEERVRTSFAGARRVIVLGCTGGAGQTVTGLMLGHTFAQNRGDRIAAVDVNPGPGALARRTRTETRETLTSLIAHAEQVTGYQMMRRYVSVARSGLEVVAAGKNPVQALDDRDYALATRTLDRFYAITLLDAAAAVVARVLPYADQIVLVAPASSDAPRAVAMTFEWLDGHGYEDLRAKAVTVINGVSRRSMDDVEQAESVARGRCRALVRIPWDDHLSLDRAPRNELRTLRGPTRKAYVALGGVVAGGLVQLPDRYPQREVSR